MVHELAQQSSLKQKWSCSEDTWQPYDASPLVQALMKAWGLPDESVFDDVTDVLVLA